MIGAISSEQNNSLKNSVIKFICPFSNATIFPSLSLTISGFFEFFDLIFLMAWWHLFFESSLYFSIFFMSPSIFLFFSVLAVYLILFKTWFFFRFSFVRFCLFVVDSASSLSFFRCYDGVLILFDIMRCCCLYLKPVVLPILLYLN